MHTFLIVSFCFIILGILGVTQLSGKMNICSDSHINSKAECVGFSADGIPRRWKKREFNYDWIGQGVVTMFVVATKDRWTELMYQAVDTSFERGQGPYQGAHPSYVLLYFTAVFVGGFFLLNIFAGVVVDTHASALRERSTKDDSIKQVTHRADPTGNIVPHGRWRRALLWIVKGFHFDMFMLVVILLDIISMSCMSYKASAFMQFFSTYANFIFSYAYSAEALAKLCAMRARTYAMNPWNRFEFGLVLLSSWGICLESVASNLPIKGDSFIRVLRIFRAIRVLRAFRLLNMQAVKSLQELVFSLSDAKVHIAEVFGTLFVIYLVFGNLTVGLFGHLCDRTDPSIPAGISKAGLVPRCMLVDEYNVLDGISFSSVGRACIALLSMNTADTWSRIMRHLAMEPGLRKNGANSISETRQHLLNYLQTRDVSYLNQARSILPVCQSVDELEALSDVLDCTSKVGDKCMSTCGSKPAAYIVCTVFFCLTSLVILNLLLAVLMQSLHANQQKIKEEERTTQATGHRNVSLLMNISKATTDWRNARHRGRRQWAESDSDDDNEGPACVGVSPLSLVERGGSNNPYSRRASKLGSGSPLSGPNTPISEGTAMHPEGSAIDAADTSNSKSKSEVRRGFAGKLLWESFGRRRSTSVLSVSKTSSDGQTLLLPGSPLPSPITEDDPQAKVEKPDAILQAAPVILNDGTASSRLLEEKDATNESSVEKLHESSENETSGALGHKTGPMAHTGAS